MSQKITVTGTDCFALAAQNLSDATQFYRIMVENDLTDPEITGAPVTIIIPDQVAESTGGVPGQ
jgi:hypothetical protein